MIVFRVVNPAEIQIQLEKLAEYLLLAGVSGEKIFESKLVACELLANVLCHAKEETGLQGEVKDGYIEMKILSKKPFELPQKITCSDIFCERGRGLFLVKELCEGQVFSEKGGIRVKIKIK